MEAPMVSIKIKGLEAANALASTKGAALGGIKIKGLAAAKGAAAKATEFEAKRITVTKGGVVLHVTELEGHAHTLAATGAKAGAKAGAAGAAGKALGAKSAMAAKGVSTGATLSAKSLGWHLGLGGLGPWLVLGAVGLAAAGIYMYFRSQQEEDMLRDEELESPA